MRWGRCAKINLNVICVAVEVKAMVLDYLSIGSI